jgi:hypothetical protein
MRIILLTVLMAVTLPSAATDQNAKIHTLMEAQGLLQMWEQQMATGKEQARQQAQQMVDKMLESLNPTPELNARFRTAFDEFMTALEPPWSAKDLVDVWAQKYGARFTDQEIDGLVAYYTSPLGKKDVAAAQAALPEFSKHFMELSTPILETATQTFIQRLQSAAKDCACQKE